MIKKNDVVQFDNDFREKVLDDIKLFCTLDETVSINFCFTYDFHIRLSVTNHVLNRSLDVCDFTLISECFNLFSEFSFEAPRYKDIPTAKSLVSLMKFSSSPLMITDLIRFCFTPRSFFQHFLFCWNINVPIDAFYKCEFQFFRDKFFVNKIDS